jgi:hypothetical protein
VDDLRSTKSRKTVGNIEKLVGENGAQATTSEEKRNMQAKISFPVQNPAPYRSSNMATADSVEVTPDSISKALKSSANGKAAGPDGVTDELLRYLDQVTPGFMVEIIQASFRVGYHPKVWREAKGVVIPKPGKDDYSKAKSYRTISLLNVMGKILEKVVADCLNDHMEKRGGFHPGRLEAGQRKEPLMLWREWLCMYRGYGNAARWLDSSAWTSKVLFQPPIPRS